MRRQTSGRLPGLRRIRKLAVKEYNEYKVTYRNFRGELARAIVHAQSAEQAREDFEAAHPRAQGIVSVEKEG